MSVTPRNGEGRTRFVRRYLSSSAHRTLAPRERVAKAHEAFEQSRQSTDDHACKCGGKCQECQSKGSGEMQSATAATLKTEPISLLRNQKPAAHRPNHFRDVLSEFRKFGSLRTMDGTVIKDRKQAVKHAYEVARQRRQLSQPAASTLAITRKSTTAKDGAEAAYLDPIEKAAREAESIELSVTKKSDGPTPTAGPMSATSQRYGGSLVRPPQQGISTHKHIVQLGPKKFRLYSRKIDPKTGKRRNLGTFSSRAAALKHERAVEYFKRACMEEEATTRKSHSSTGHPPCPVDHTCKSSHSCNACCDCPRCRSAVCTVTYKAPAIVGLTLKRANADSLIDLPERRALVHRNGNKDIETDDARMTASGILATSDRDRQGDIIECGGVDFSDHKLNPVVLWDHGKWGTIPIGITEDEDGHYTVRFLPDRDIIVQTTHFADTQTGRQIYVLVRDRIIRANSIAVKDIEVEPLPPDPSRGHFTRRDADGRKIPFKHILKSALAEVTWTSLPANPDAVMSLLASNRIDSPGFNKEELDPIIRKSLLWHIPRAKVWSNGITLKSL